MTDLELLYRAYKAATRSPDPSTQNGAVLVKHDLYYEDCNRPPNGLSMSPLDWERPTKYALVEHAERNVIYQAARWGLGGVHGMTMGAVWASCADCARAIVQAGVWRLVRHHHPGGRWAESVALGDRILLAGGVEIVDVKVPILGAPTVLFDGAPWDPSKEESLNDLRDWQHAKPTHPGGSYPVAADGVQGL